MSSTKVLANGVAVVGKIEIWAKGEKDLLDEFDNAVVYLEGGKTNIVEPVVSVDQKNKLFKPRVLALIKGQKVNFYNRDKISHNVFSTDQKNEFDLGRYPKGEFKQVTYNEKGLHKVYCNIHQSMILDILVLDYPHFSVTDKKGSYSISNVPEGKYQLKVWHIYGGQYSTEIEIKKSDIELPKIKLTNASFVKDVIKHKNKQGKKYRKKRRGGRGKY